MKATVINIAYSVYRSGGRRHLDLLLFIIHPMFRPCAESFEDLFVPARQSETTKGEISVVGHEAVKTRN